MSGAAKRWGAVAIGAALLIGLAVGVTLAVTARLPSSGSKPAVAINGSPPAPATTAATSTSDSAAPSLSPERARQIEQQLKDGTDEQLLAAVAAPSGQALSPDLAKELATLALQIDESSFRRLDATTATVTAHTTDLGGVSRAWTVTLVEVDGSWRIAATEPAAT